MIHKESDVFDTDDIYLKAGASAERQMAYYLRHAFGKSDKIHVLNGIRLQTTNDGVIQIDHLVIHEYGMIIIESKSVTSKVKINIDGSWERLWNNSYEGMKSPVQQAKRQAESFIRYLKDYEQQLFPKKILGIIRFSFDKAPVKILIAISDKGRIERSEHEENDFVFKADQITGKIHEIYDDIKKKDGLFSLTIPEWVIGEQSIARIIAFLKVTHKPVHMDKLQTEYIETHETEAIKHIAADSEHSIKKPISTCPVCGKEMDIVWGEKYKNYYWKCRTCFKNISTAEKCPDCCDKLRIRKEGNQYFIYCTRCQIEKLYHEVVNPPH